MKEDKAKIFLTIFIVILIMILYFIYLYVPFISKGGFLMVPLMFCSIYATFIIIERFIYLKKVVVNSDSLMLKINQAIAENNIDEAYLLCENKDTPLSTVLIAGLNNFQESKEAIKEAVADAGLLEIPKLEENLNVLNLIARISPLMGLLGTVTGMMKAFTQIKLLGGNVNASVLAGGISEALMTTATGMIIAIIVLVFHNYLSNKFERIVLDIESSVIMLINSIIKRREELKK